MKKAWIVARHEFATTVKRWGFVLVTFVLPLILGAVIGGAFLLQVQSAEREDAKIEEAKIGWVDQAGVVMLPPPEGKPWVSYASEAEAKRRMSQDKVAIVILLEPDYVKTGAVKVLTTIRPSLFNVETTFVRLEFREWLARNLLPDADPALVARARIPAIQRDVEYLTTTGEAASWEQPREFVGRVAVGVGFFFLLFISISVVGGYLIQGLADEKENRVLEMVVSSVSPTQLLAGKLIGLGGAGLLQVTVWSILGVSTALALAVQFLLHPGHFVLCLVYYLLGYLLFGSLLLGLGSLGTNQREATQYTWLLTMLSISPLFVWMTIATEPHGTLARVFTYIPLTTSCTMMLRYGIDPAGTAAWEIALSLGVLAIATVVGLRLSAKIYRVGLLLYGKRPTPREILRWLRA